MSICQKVMYIFKAIPVAITDSIFFFASWIKWHSSLKVLLKYYFKILEFTSSLEIVVSSNIGSSSSPKCDKEPWVSLHEWIDISAVIAGPLLKYLCPSSWIFSSGLFTIFFKVYYFPSLLHVRPYCFLYFWILSFLLVSSHSPSLPFSLSFCLLCSSLFTSMLHLS